MDWPIYKIFFREAIRSSEVEYIGNHSIYDLLEKAPLIQKLGISNKTPEPFLSVEECKNAIRNNTNLVHFEGTIKMKRFADNMSNSKYKGRSYYGFGTSSK